MNIPTSKEESSFVFVPEKFFAKKDAAIAVILVATVLFYYFFASSPGGFESGKLVNVRSGDSITEIISNLEKENIIRSPLLLKAIIFFSGNEKKVVSGDYIFSEPAGVFTVAYRLLSGKFDLTAIKITVPEGTPSFKIAEIFEKSLRPGSSVPEVGSENNTVYNFDAEKFIKLAEKKEGYLFPDTYFVLPNTTAEEAVKMLEDTFNEKIKEHTKEIGASGHNLKDLIIMASIIENEAGKPEDRKLISGILWKRISIGMPLQVDAPFAYISDKSTYELTMEDLKQNSPYNTYKNLGLPPGAIGNPGMESILAAAEPEQSKYLYYLSDKNGNIHYAETFEGHKKNKALYIK